jgi:ribosomal-protein-alanine N-acetyltransferase
MMKYLRFDAHQHLGHTRDFINWMAEIFEKKVGIRWGIELKETGHIIGTGGLYLSKPEFRCAEVGYHIGRVWWGHGFATETLQAMIEFGFKHMDLNRIEGKHHAGNDTSGRVMQKVGFQYEGILRQGELKEDRFVDVVQFSLLHDEYFGKQTGGS